jgi:hypothetical protein
VLLTQIEAGQLEDANRTLELLKKHAADPAVCNQETLNTLQKAKVLAMIQRSHIQRELRSLQASRLFNMPAEVSAPTWRIDG